MNVNDLITADAAGRILGVSSSTVRRRAESGELPYEQKMPGPNGPYLFKRSVVIRFARDRLAAREGAA